MNTKNNQLINKNIDQNRRVVWMQFMIKILCLNVKYRKFSIVEDNLWDFFGII